MRDDHGHKLQNNRCADIWHYPEGKNRQPFKSTPREHIKNPAVIGGVSKVVERIEASIVVDEVIGVVYEDELLGEVITEDLTGTVIVDELQGEVIVEELEGEI